MRRRVLAQNDLVRFHALCRQFEIRTSTSASDKAVGRLVRAGGARPRTEYRSFKFGGPMYEIGPAWLGARRWLAYSGPGASSELGRMDILSIQIRPDPASL